MFSYLENLQGSTKAVGLSLLVGLAVYQSFFGSLCDLCNTSTLIILSLIGYIVYKNKITSSPDNNISIKAEKARFATYGDPCPEGWYSLCYSWEVKKGGVKEIKALGKRFAVFRNESNEVGILDSYCPHLGANLTKGGKVVGDCITCPFHEWAFDIEGKCTNIPYNENKNNKIPSNAHTRAYKAEEFCGMICIYWSNDFYNNNNNNNNKVGSVPRCIYKLPRSHEVLSKILDGRMKYGGSFEGGLIRMHLQEFTENAGDFRHFGPIHSHMMIPFTKYEIPFLGKLGLKIRHIPDVKFGKREDNTKSFMYFINSVILQWNGKDIPKTGADAVATFVGPGSIVFFTFRIPELKGEFVLFHTHLPCDDELKLNVRFHWYYSPNINYLLVLYVVGGWVSQWQNDIDIWENKVFLNKPCLIKGDGPVMKTRQWFRQFYNNKIAYEEEDIKS